MELNKLQDICIKVGEKLGKGYTENIYNEGICMYLRQMNIQYAKEVVLQVELDNVQIGNVRADIVLPNERVVIECKAIDSELREAHLPQIITYMNILDYNNGLFVNYIQNPSKQAVQIYSVQRTNSLFTFRVGKSEDAVEPPVYVLDSCGNTVEDDTNWTKIIEDWIEKNITATNCEVPDLLSKTDCKKEFSKIQVRVSAVVMSQFVSAIEEKCCEKFKDKQIAGVKYNGVISGWKLV